MSLFALSLVPGWKVLGATRAGFRIKNLKSGEVAVATVPKTASPAPLRAVTSVSTPRVVEHCDGRHACRHHGRACPEIAARRREQALKREAARERFDRALSAKIRRGAPLRDDELREVFRRRKQELADHFPVALAPHQRLNWMWETLAQDAREAGLTLADCGWMTAADRNRLQHALNGNIFSRARRGVKTDLRELPEPASLAGVDIPLGGGRFHSPDWTAAGLGHLGEFPEGRSLNCPSAYGVLSPRLDSDIGWPAERPGHHALFEAIKKAVGALPAGPVMVRTTGQEFTTFPHRVLAFFVQGDPRPYEGRHDMRILLPSWMGTKTGMALVRILALAASTRRNPVLSTNERREDEAGLADIDYNVPLTSPHPLPFMERTYGWVDGVCPWTISRAALALRKVYGADAHILLQMRVRVGPSDDRLTGMAVPVGLPLSCDVVTPDGRVTLIRRRPAPAPTPIVVRPEQEAPVEPVAQAPDACDLPAPDFPAPSPVEPQSVSVSIDDPEDSEFGTAPSSPLASGSRTGALHSVALGLDSFLSQLGECQADLGKACDRIFSSPVGEAVESPRIDSAVSTLLSLASMGRAELANSATEAARALAKVRGTKLARYKRTAPIIRVLALVDRMAGYRAWALRLFGSLTQASRAVGMIGTPTTVEDFRKVIAAFLENGHSVEVAYDYAAFALVTRDLLELADLWDLTAEERNRLVHALNGNIFSLGALARAGLVDLGIGKLLIPLVGGYVLKLSLKRLAGSEPRAPKGELASGHGYTIVERAEDHDDDLFSGASRYFCSRVAKNRIVPCCRDPDGHRRYQAPARPSCYFREGDNMEDILEALEYLFPRICPVHGESLRNAQAAIFGRASWEMTEDEIGQALGACWVQSFDWEKCENEEHDEEHVHRALAEFPVVGRTSGAEMTSLHDIVMGFGTHQCPLCWPRGNLWTGPILSRFLSRPVPLGTWALVFRVNAALAEQIRQPRFAPPTVYLGASRTEAHIELPLGWNIKGLFDPEASINNETNTFPPEAFADVYMYMIPYIMTLSGDVTRLWAAWRSDLWALLPDIDRVLRGDLWAFSAGGYDILGEFLSIRDARIHRGRQHAQSFCLLAAPSVRLSANYMMGSPDVVFLESQGSELTPDLECEGLGIWAPCDRPGSMTISTSTNRLRRAIIPRVTPFALKLAISAFLGTPGSTSSVPSVIALSTAAWRDDHAGVILRISVSELLTYRLPVRQACGCLQCLMRARYGPITHIVSGTRGDRVPFEALYPFLTKWGLDLVLVSHQSPEEGLEDLRAIERGRLHEVLARLATEYAQISGQAGLVIGHPGTGADIEISMAPPTWALRRWVFRMGPLVDSLLSFLSRTSANLPRVGAYPGALSLPRSADGKTFLRMSTNVDRPIPEMWATGSSGMALPPDAVSVRPGDHFSQFEKVQVVYTHGGAGTVQTAAAAGARVVVVNQVLDRLYVDPLDAGRGVITGQDPEKTILLLLARDFAPIVLAWRVSLSLGFSALRWYCVAHLTSDMLTVVGLAYICWDHLVVVPGSILGSILASLMLAWTSKGTVFFLSLVIQIWGATLLSILGLDVASVLMAVLRLGRAVGRSPVGATLAGLGGVGPGLVGLAVDHFLLPLVTVSIRAYQAPRSYIGLVWAYGVPIHAVVKDAKTGQVFEGREVAPSRYRLGRISTPLDEKSVALWIPTLLVIDEALLRSSSAAPYNGLLWNCHTVILAEAAANVRLAGAAVLVLAPLIVLNALAVMSGVLVLLIAALIVLVLLLSFPTSAKVRMPILQLLSGRFRRLSSVVLNAQIDSPIGRIVAFGRAMTTLAALTPADREAELRMSQVRARAYAALAAHDSAAITDMLRRAREGPRDEYGTITDELIELGILSDAGLLHGVDPEDPTDDHVLALKTVTNAQPAGADLQAFGHLVDLVHGELDELDGFIASPVVRAARVVWNEVWDDRLRGGVRRLFDANPVFGEGELDPAAVAALSSYSGGALVKHAIFRMPDQPSGALPGHQAIDMDDINFLARLAAPAVALGLPGDSALQEALLVTKDIFHGKSAPVQSAENESRAQIERVYAETAAVRGSVQRMYDGLFLWLNYVAQSTVYSYLAFPIRALLGLFSLFLSALITLIVRLVAAVIGLVVHVGPFTQEQVGSIAGVLFVAVAMLDPRHRTKTKPVWAILWKRARSSLSKTEQFFFGLREMRPRKTTDYVEWMDIMAEHLSRTGCDVSVLSRLPPRRAVYTPTNPVGVHEYHELGIALEHHFRENATVRRMMAESIAAGNPLAIDGVYVATPESTEASLSRYTRARPEVSPEARAALIESADALFDQYPHLYDRPAPTLPAVVVDTAKWKHAGSGLQFRGVVNSREALRASPWYDAFKRAVESILESGELPEVGFSGFPKAYVTSLEKVQSKYGIRTVTAGDRLTACVFNVIAGERNKRVPKVSDGLLNMIRRSEGSLLTLRDHFRALPHMFTGDGEAFDSSIVAEIGTVGSVRLFERGLESHHTLNAKAALSIVSSYYEQLTHGFVVNYMNGAVIHKTGGGGTGSAATTPDNRDWTRLVFLASWALATGRPAAEFFSHFFLANASDDVAFSCDDIGRNALPGMLREMLRNYGVVFNLCPQADMNDILHLETVRADELASEADLYNDLSIPVPEIGLRHSVKRLLLMRSAVRSDRASFNPEVLSLHFAQRATGYEMLCAHSRETHTLMVNDWMGSLQTYLECFFRTPIIDVEHDSGGLVETARARIADSAPSSRLLFRARRKYPRIPVDELATHPSSSKWIEDEQRRARRMMRQTRLKGYKGVFRAWVSPPPPIEQQNVGKRWKKTLSTATVFSPVMDVVRLTAETMTSALDWVPRSLTGILAERDIMPVARPFNTWTFSVETYIWRRAVLRSSGRRPPTTSEMAALIRESPFSGVTDLAAFNAFLAVNDNLRVELAATLGVPVAGRFALSNDAVCARILVVTIIYSMIDRLIQTLEQLPVLGALVLLGFSLFRWLEVLYSIQAYAFWLCTATASLAISNSVPRDRYIVQKIMAVVLTDFLPVSLFSGAVGVFKALPYLARIIEAQTWVPALLLDNATELAGRGLAPVDGLWVPCATEAARQGGVIAVVGGTGTGKSTSLPATFLELGLADVVFIVCPTNALVQGYTNRHVEPARIVRVERSTARDQSFRGSGIVALTAAQYLRRLRQIEGSGDHILVILDEAHVSLTEIPAIVAHATATTGRLIMVTATPGGYTGMNYFRDERVIRVEAARQHIRHATVEVEDFPAAVQSMAAHCQLDEMAVYHPSVRTLELWGTYFFGLGASPKIISARHGFSREKAPTLFTGVVLAGANLDPAPAALAYMPHGYESVVDPSTVIGVPGDEDNQAWPTASPWNIENLLVLRPRGLSTAEIHQLEGRVGREREGRVFRMRSTLPAKDPGWIGCAADLMDAHREGLLFGELADAVGMWAVNTYAQVEGVGHRAARAWGALAALVLTSDWKGLATTLQLPPTHEDYIDLDESVRDLCARWGWPRPELPRSLALGAMAMVECITHDGDDIFVPVLSGGHLTGVFLE